MSQIFWCLTMSISCFGRETLQPWKCTRLSYFFRPEMATTVVQFQLTTPDDSWWLWRPRSLTTADDSWRLLTTPDDPWRPVTTPDDPWRPLTTPDWRPLTTPDDPWRPLTTPDDCWRLLTTPDDCWRPLTTPDDPWRPLTTPDDPWPTATGDLCPFWRPCLWPLFVCWTYWFVGWMGGKFQQFTPHILLSVLLCEVEGVKSC